MKKMFLYEIVLIDYSRTHKRLLGLSLVDFLNYINIQTALGFNYKK